MRSVATFAPSAALRLGKSLTFLFLITCFGFGSPALAQNPNLELMAVTDCAGMYNPNLSCTSNDIKINDVGQVAPGTVGRYGDVAQPAITSCIEGELAYVDIALTTQLNANSRYDVLTWFGIEGNDPRGATEDNCYASSLPNDPEAFDNSVDPPVPVILDHEGAPDACLDVDSSTDPITQYMFQVPFTCQDLVSLDINGDVVPVPDGKADVFALVTWFQNNSLLCGDNVDPGGIDLGQSMEPGVNPKCDISLLGGLDIVVLESATIQVVKNSTGGEHTFGFTTDIPGLSPGFTLDTTGDGTESTAVIQLDDADVGETYNITEAVPAGWSLATATCSNGDTPDAVTPLDGQDVVCTFNNVALGSVSVVKQTIGAAGTNSFDFTTDLPGGNFSRTTAASGISQPYTVSNVPTGIYSIVEDDPTPAFDLTSATCDDGTNLVDTGFELDVSDGETVTCTFVNTARGTIIVEKQTLPDGSPQSFTFTGDAAGSISDGGGIVVSGLVPGAYRSTETVPTGWVLNSIVCDDDGSTGDTVSGEATFWLDPGEVITCVFTNVQDGSIEVVKTLSATGPAVETFSFTSDFNGTFQLTGEGDSTGPISVAPGGPYSVTEDDPTADGWVNTGAFCTGQEAPTTDITVSPGEAVVCTFTNTPLGSATIIKNTVGGADDTFDFVGDPPFNGLQLTTVAGTAAQDFSYELAAGQYTVTEDPVPAGWALTSVGCVEDGDQDSSAVNPTATLDVELAETVTCTFENTADGTLIIRKETIPDGMDVPFTFTGDAAGDIRDYSTFAEELSISGQPGTYASAESVPAGWALTDIECTGMVASTVSIGVGTDDFEDGDTNVSVDLKAGETVICTFENTALGSITIEKATVGGTGAFTFNQTGDFSGSFQLDTSGNNPDSTTLSDLLPDRSYTISEVVPSGWTLGDITCSGNQASTVTVGGAGLFDAGDVGVTINLQDGETVNCTFTNSAWGNIVVDKVTDPQGSLQSFDFTPSYNGGTPFSLADGDTPNDSGLLEPSAFAGTYSVSEAAVTGWDQTSATCDDGSDPATIDLAPGETVTCTFVNTIQRGNIVVVKQTDPDGSTEDFGFTSNYGSPFTLVDGQSNDSGPMLPSSEVGPYSVVEDPEAGWNLTLATCDDGSDPSQIDLSPGETVTCTFVNTIERGNIVVVKQTDPDGSAEDFDFTSNYGSPFTLVDDQSNDSGPLLPSSEGGTYSVTESPEAGWALTSATCTGEGNTPASIDLQPGETVTCTFTNTLGRSSIIVQKVTDPDTSQVQFEFTTNYDGAPFLLGHGDLDNSGALLPSSEAGPYTVTEALPPGWSLTSATCDNGDDPSAIDLGSGETVTCTFVNTIERGTITVEKQTLPDGSPEVFFFSTNFAGPFSLSDDGVELFFDLLPSSEALTPTYSVTEDAKAGWNLTNVVCLDSAGAPENPAAIDLGPGETVSCVFENTQQSRIELALQLFPTLADTFQFTGELPETLGHAFVVGKDVDPGIYGVRLSRTALLTAIGLWIDVSFTCDDGDSWTDLTDLVEVIANYNVAPGETVRCTLFLELEEEDPVPVIPVPVNNPLALLFLTLALLATGWYFRPRFMR